MPRGKHKRPADIGSRISEGKRPGSVAMRKRVEALYREGVTPKNIARQTGAALNTVRGWVAGLPNNDTGFSRRRHGYAAARIARLTKREGEAIRMEMQAKEDDACVFCGLADFAKSGWLGPAWHHYEDGIVDRAHKGCNAVRRNVMTDVIRNRVCQVCGAEAVTRF